MVFVVERCCISCIDGGEGIGGVAHRSLNDGHVMINTRSAMASSDALVASMAGMARALASIYTLNMGSRNMAVTNAGAWAQGTISGSCEQLMIVTGA